MPFTVSVYVPAGVPGLGGVPPPPPPPPPPHPASARVSKNPKVSGTIGDRHWPTPGWFRRLMAHAIAGRTKASINRLLRPDIGETGGSGRERGMLTEAVVVVMLTVALVALLPAMIELGTVQVACDGAPVQVRLTLWLNPPWPERLNV